MSTVLNSSNEDHKMSKFEDILVQTKETFYRENNDSCIFSKKYGTDIYLLKEKNNTKVIAKLNLKKNKVKTTSCIKSVNICSISYFDKTNTIIGGADDQCIYLYNATDLKFVQRVSVGKGIINSLLMEEQALYVGSDSFLSIYKFKYKFFKNNSYEMDLISHFKLEDNSRPNNYTTIVKDKKKNFWIGGQNSNKVKMFVIHQEYHLYSNPCKSYNFKLKI